MNKDRQDLNDFAEKVRQRMTHIMGAANGGRAELCGEIAAEVCGMAARMKTYAQVAESLDNPARYSLRDLSTYAPSGFDE